MLNQDINMASLKQKLLNTIPPVLINIIKTNNKEKNASLHYDNFTSYFKNLVHYLNVEAGTLVYSFILIDLFTEKSNLILDHVNIYNIFFVALIISYKLNEDILYKEKLFCKIGNITSENFCLMEKFFLETLDYNIFIKCDLFNSYLNVFIQ